ncbi:MAG: hypothetical protein NT154_09860 [Verrucomicrobia bacterium]|nr:hypothetical protein [Verrucomicrobiota bacterium]
MTAPDMQAILDRYESKFDNLWDISIPPVGFDPRFFELLQQAIDTGVALTWEKIEAVFGPVGKEEVQY